MRPRHAPGVEEDEESNLKLFATYAGRHVPEAIQAFPDHSVAAMPGIAIDQDRQREGVVKTQAFGLAQGMLDSARPQNHGQIENRAGNGRHGNPVSARDFVGDEVCGVTCDVSP